MDALDRESSSISTTDTPIARVQAACRAYVAETGNSVSWPMTLEESTEVGNWLVQQNWTGAVWHDYLVPRPWIYRDAGVKASWAQRAPCTVCNVITPDGNPPFPVSFPIPVRPFTKQVRHTSRYLTEVTRKALKKRAAANQAQPMAAWRNISICASVVAVQGHPMKIKDVDNSAKAILDTMKGIVFPDDRQIEHLSTSRIQHEDNLAFYLIYLRPVYPMLEDVIDRKCRLKLAGLAEQVEDQQGGDAL